MPLLRLIIAGLVAFFAMVAVVFTAAVVLFGGLVGWVLQLFGVRTTATVRRRGSKPGRPRSPLATGDVIEVETTKVPDEPPAR